MLLDAYGRPASSRKQRRLWTPGDDVSGPASFAPMGVGMSIARRPATPLAWSPATYFGADLAVWLRADLGVTLNSGRVSNWADQSGNGFHFAQATGANQPLFTASGVNGQPTIDFLKTRPDSLQCASLTASGWAGMTTILIYNFTSNANFGMWFSKGTGLEELRENSSGATVQYINSSAAASGAVAHGSTWGMITGRHDGSNNIDVSWKKTTEGTGGPAGGAGLTDTEATIGSRAGASFPVTMSLAEVIIVKKYITNTDRDATWDDYAGSRYALP